MAGTNDDKEIGGESPHHSAHSTKQRLETQRPHQDVESQQQDKYIHYDVWQPQLIDRAKYIERRTRSVAGCYLIGRHTAKESVGPAGHLSRLVKMVSDFLACTHGSRIVLAGKYKALAHRRGEVGKT